MTFVSDVKKYSEAMKLDADKVLRGTVLGLFSETIAKTPVDRDGRKVRGALIGGGTAKNSWFTSLNADPVGLERSPNRAGDAAMTEMREAASKMRFGDTITIINRAPYIHKLEFGGYPVAPKKGKGKTVGGFSTQAPTGMMRQAIARARANIKRLIRGIK